MLLSARRLPTSLIGRQTSLSAVPLRSLHCTSSAYSNEAPSRRPRTAVTSKLSSHLHTDHLILPRLQITTFAREYTAAPVRLRDGSAYNEDPAQAEAQIAEDEMETFEEEEMVGEHDDFKPVGDGPVTKFQELAGLGLVDENVIRTLTQKMGLETMTSVQSGTLREALEGRDVLAQAKTGTGKTLGFLLPVLQNILNEDPSLAQPQNMGRPRYSGNSRGQDIRAIIISPTRELAEQIAVEARKLTQDTRVVVQTAVGGTQKMQGLRKIQVEGCHMLVGTPGRLKDILSDSMSGIKAPNLSALVLDEADRLMDDGFWPEIQEIQSYLPEKSEKDRQTLMYSATVASDVVKLVRSFMKPDLHYFASVRGGDSPTHEKVQQWLVTTPGIENWMPTLLEICQRELRKSAESTGEKKKPFKAIVYFNSKAETQLAFSLFKTLRQHTSGFADDFADTRVYGIHARLSQAQRTVAATDFRNSQSAILMSSDVTARGMDFPNVTHVIQVGIPGTREDYIHRIGRTARAGQEGQAYLIVSGMMQKLTKERLGKLKPKPDNTLECAKLDFSSHADKLTNVNGVLDQVNATPQARQIFQSLSDAMRKQEPRLLNQVYLVLLSLSQKLDKNRIVESLDRLTKLQWQMSHPPPVSPRLARLFRLDHVENLNISDSIDSRSDRRRPERRGGGYPDRSFSFSRTQSGYGSRDDRRGRGDFDRRDDFSRGRGGFDRRDDFSRGRGGFDRRDDFSRGRSSRSTPSFSSRRERNDFRDD